MTLQALTRVGNADNELVLLAGLVEHSAHCSQQPLEERGTTLASTVTQSGHLGDASANGVGCIASRLGRRAVTK